MKTPQPLEKTATPADDLDPAPTLLRQGNLQAFDTLYHRHAPRVLGCLLRLTGGNRGEAEDLTQETFLASFAACQSYTAKGRPLAWLLGIAVRRWRDKHRSARPAFLPLPESLTEARPGVETQVVERAVLDIALEKLEPPFRTVLLLIAGQQLSYKEAAEITGEPLGTVKWRFHEATRKMRLLLQSEELSASRVPLPKATRRSADSASTTDTNAVETWPAPQRIVALPLTTDK